MQATLKKTKSWACVTRRKPARGVLGTGGRGQGGQDHGCRPVGAQKRLGHGAHSLASHLSSQVTPATETLPGDPGCRDRPDRPSPARPFPCPHPRNVLATRTLSGDQVEAVRGLSQAVACIPRAGVHARALQRIPIPALGNRPGGSPPWCPWPRSSLDWWGDPGPEASLRERPLVSQAPEQSWKGLRTRILVGPLWRV